MLHKKFNGNGRSILKGMKPENDNYYLNIFGIKYEVFSDK